jgi:hypothetical protein
MVTVSFQSFQTFWVVPWPATVEGRRRLKWWLVGSTLWLHRASLRSTPHPASISEEQALPAVFLAITKSSDSESSRSATASESRPVPTKTKTKSALRTNHIQGSKTFTWLSRGTSSASTIHKSFHYRVSRTGWSSGEAIYLRPKGAWFEHRQGYRLSSRFFFVTVFFSFGKKIALHYLACPDIISLQVLPYLFVYLSLIGC